MSTGFDNNQALPTLSSPCKRPKDDCPQLPGTILRINIPPGAVINLLNIIEIASPGGICLIVRLPLLAGLLDNDGKRSITIADIQEAVQKAGGSIEIG